MNAQAAYESVPIGRTPDDDTIRAHLPLVRRVVRRLAHRLPRSLEVEEMVRWGLVGLFDALCKYDPGRSASFETYAQLRIRGAILDRLRSEDWTARGARHKATLLERTYQRLEGELGRAATEEEVAAALGLDLAGLHALLGEIECSGVLRLEDLGVEPEMQSTDVEDVLEGKAVDPAQAVLSRERVQMVGDAIGRLPAKEKQVIGLYYHEGITMREVGAVMSLTESRVSQLHSQALLRLRGFLREHFGAAEGDPEGVDP
jgi:RNA polymerase sigma factor for flagellar operon FliA